MASKKTAEKQTLQKKIAKLEKDQEKRKPQYWIRWLLSFHDIDLESLISKEWEALHKDAVEFTLWRIYNKGVIAVPDSESKPDRSALKGIQQMLRDALNHFTAGSISMWSVPAKINNIQLVGYYDKGDGQQPIGLLLPIPSSHGFVLHVRPLVSDWTSSFWLTVVYLLEAYGTLLRKCEECSRIFLKTRRQEYCSKQCSQRVRARRWYEAHREKAKEKRRQTYEDEVKRIAGKNVKVARRSPKQA